MFKALLKKQMMEINLQLIKRGKKGGKSSTAGFIILYALLCVSVSSMFFIMGQTLCQSLCDGKNDWLYFSIMGLMATAVGMFGSVLTTYSTLYKAKDNEFLLSMPIKPSMILSVRLLAVWVWSLIFASLVLVPTVIIYQINCGFNAAALVLDIVLLLCVSVLVMALACILGWAVAKLSTRFKNKSYITVIFSLAFLALYYFCYAKAYSILQTIAENADKIAIKIKGWAYPLYLMGKTGEGDALSALLLVLTATVFFTAVMLVMSRSFIKIATAKTGTSRAKYSEKSVKAISTERALLFKEAKRFTSSANYMMNCALGTVMLLVLGVLVLVKRQFVISVFSETELPETFLSVIACAVICAAAAMNDITAPSVSLEGKNLWIVQSFPVPARQVLRAKLRLHLLITEIPVIICSVCVCIALRLSLPQSIAVIIFTTLFVLLSALFGLFLNLKMPNLSWTDETVVIKQSIGVMIAIFAGLIFTALIAVLYLFIGSFCNDVIYLSVCSALLAALDAVILRWVNTRGAKIFERL